MNLVIICGGLLEFRQRGAGIHALRSSSKASGGTLHVPCSFPGLRTKPLEMPSRAEHQPAICKNPHLVRRGIGPAAHQGTMASTDNCPNAHICKLCNDRQRQRTTACRGAFPDVCSRTNLQDERRGTAMSHRFTRRRFMVTAGATASTVLGSSLFNLDSVWAAPVMRRNLGGMAATDPVIVSYRKAIKAMKALPTTNPLSWDYQAAIHGTTLSGSHIAWNTCEHGTHFFWCWHRMYLYWFERIIRKMSGDPGWALPFWDYVSASQRTLPVPFPRSQQRAYICQSRVRAGMPGPLLSPHRMSIPPPAWRRSIISPRKATLKAIPTTTCTVISAADGRGPHSGAGPGFLCAPLQH